MAKDATPDRIRLVNSNFANDNHEQIAELLQEEWSASTSFTQLGEEYEPHRATLQKVYKSYFGVPESLFNDGIDDQRTIEQIREDHGSYKEYRELRQRGDLDPSEWNGVEWKEGHEPEEEVEVIEFSEHMEKAQEAYRKGYRDGMRDAMNDLQEQEAN